MRFELPNANDPQGNYAGGILRVDCAGRNLKGYDSLTFWANLFDYGFPYLPVYTVRPRAMENTVCLEYIWGASYERSQFSLLDWNTLSSGSRSDAFKVFNGTYYPYHGRHLR
jgi:hypothetical protein